MIYRKRKLVLNVVMLGVCLLATSASFAQTWDEWFEQKKTQLKYLEKQIAELQLYITDLEKGYRIVESGLQTIHDIKQGDFNMHNAYFTSLLNTNPAIGQSSTVSDCYRLSTAIGTACQALRSRLTAPPALAAPDQVYVGSVLQSLQTRTTTAMNELSTLTSNGSLSLKDEERQRRIEAVHTDLSSQYRFIQHFSAQVSLYGAQRMQEQTDEQQLQQIYSLP